MQGDLDAAIEYYTRSIEIMPTAEAHTFRGYEPRHYPYFNLSRVYVKQGKIQEAIAEIKVALELEPGYVVARKELHRLLGMLN